MKKARLKQEKQKKEVITEEKFSVRVVVVTAVLMLLALVGMYFLTEKIVSKRATENSNSNEERETVNVREINTIKYSDIKNIKSSSYYLFFDKEDDEMNNTYDTLINSLATANYPISFYYVTDVDFGKKEELDDLDEIKVKDTTLLLVEDGKIKDKYVGSSEVSNHLFSFFVKVSNSNESKDEEDTKEESKDSEKEDKEAKDEKEDKED